MVYEVEVIDEAGTEDRVRIIAPTPDRAAELARLRGYITGDVDTCEFSKLPARRSRRRWVWVGGIVLVAAAVSVAATVMMKSVPIRSRSMPTVTIRSSVLKPIPPSHAEYRAAAMRVEKKYDESVNDLPGFLWRSGNWKEVHDALAAFMIECERNGSAIDEEAALRGMYDLTDLDWMDQKITRSYFVSVGPDGGSEAMYQARSAAGVGKKLYGITASLRAKTTDGMARAYMGLNR